MSMLSTMSFPRWMILSCALATPVLGWFAWQKTEQLNELEQELAMVPTLVREIQTKAIQLDTLVKMLEPVPASTSTRGAIWPPIRSTVLSSV